MKEHLIKIHKLILIFLVLVSLLIFPGCDAFSSGCYGGESEEAVEYRRKERRKEREEEEKTAAKKEEEKVALYEAGPPEEIFTNTNVYSVFNGGTSPKFSLLETTKIAMVKTYHWNNAQGKAPGTIGLTDKNGKSYGHWKASSEPGQGGVKSAYWKVSPNIELPAGIYTITDSDPSTWAQNKESKGEGMVWVFAATKKEN